MPGSSVAATMRANGTPASSLTCRTLSASGASNRQKHDSSDGTYVEPRYATAGCWFGRRASRASSQARSRPGRYRSTRYVAIALHVGGRPCENNRANLWVYSCGVAAMWAASSVRELTPSLR